MNLLDFLALPGQERTRLRDEYLGGLLNYYLGPTGIPQRLGLVDMMNPVSDVGRAMTSSQEMLAPGRTPMERVGAGATMLADMASVAAPAAATRIAGGDATQAVVEGLLGAPMAVEEAGRRVVERLNQPGPVPTMYSNPIDFEQFRRQRKRDDLVKRLTRAIEDVQSGAFQARRDAAAFDLHRKGLLPLPRGTRVSPPSGWDMPGNWQISGYFVDPQNPNKFGYNLTSDSGDVFQAFVSDPQIGYKMDNPQKFGAGFRAYAGPTANPISYAPKDAVPAAPQPTLTDAEKAAIDAEYAALFGTPSSSLTDPAVERGAEIMQMLRAGRASEITDDMLDMGDPVLNARLNMYLYDNYDLPMDEASRMARAKAFDADLLHGTAGEDYVAMREGGQSLPVDRAIWTSTTAEGGPNFIAASRMESAGQDSGRVLPLMARTGSNLTVDAAGRHAVDVRGIRSAADEGYDSVTLQNVREFGSPDLTTSVAIFDPTRIRSRFARFDPRLAHLRNLSAGVGGLGLLATQMPEQQRDEEIRQYLGGLL